MAVIDLAEAVARELGIAQHVHVPGWVDAADLEGLYAAALCVVALATRVGAIQFRVPQVRGGLDFYPSALEKGVRSEQALMLALAAELGVSRGVVTEAYQRLAEDGHVAGRGRCGPHQSRGRRSWSMHR